MRPFAGSGTEGEVFVSASLVRTKACEVVCVLRTGAAVRTTFSVDLQAGDWRLETGDWRLETGDWPEMDGAKLGTHNGSAGALRQY